MSDLVNGICICGHRGERVYGAENTISAMRYAMESGVDMVETDVRMTRDGHLILMHNADLADLTDGSGLVQDRTLEEIMGMNAATRRVPGGGFEPPEFEHPALFDDFLELARQFPDVILNIELKDRPGRNGCTSEFAYRSCELIAEKLFRGGFGKRTLINSFSGELVEHVFELYGDAFHYHAFYPWDNMGPMKRMPHEFCDVVCLLNWEVGPDGRRRLVEDSMPDEYFDEVRRYGMDIIVSGGRGDAEIPNLDRSIARGGNILMTDDPAKVVSHYRKNV